MHQGANRECQKRDTSGLAIVEALEGRPVGVTCESLDAQLRTLSCHGTSSECEVKELKPDELAEWKAHIQRGHVPYRRDCRRCVEGAGLGIQHRKIRHKTSFSLSVDLFGPMNKHERGRDEESVSANPHVKYGLW